jgi:hypothetical protein
MRRLMFPLTLAVLLVTAPASFGQEPAPVEPSSYVAVRELQVAIWRAMTDGQAKQVEAHARHLWSLQPGDPLAAAALLSDETKKLDTDEALSIGRRGLRNLDRLTRLPNISDEEFAHVQRRVRVILNSAVGRAYVDRGDEVTARKYLKEAVALEPGNARSAYIAGQAFLRGRHPDMTVGYWLLARSVVLTQGTKAGDEIAQYAYDQYTGAGGKREDWSRFLERATQPAPPIGLEVAAIPAPATNVASTIANAPPPPPATESSRTVAARTSSNSTSTAPSIPTGSTSAESAAAGRAASVGTQSAQQAPPSPGNATLPTPPTPRSATAPVETASARTESYDLRRIEQSLPESSRDEAREPAAIQPDPPRPVGVGSPDLPVEIAENRYPDIPPPSARPALRGGAPVSIGILMQAHIASKGNRSTIVFALSDMLRRLRKDDEAFVVSYGQGIGIQQDLTWNYDLLEKAMDNISPDPGAQLYDAVNFSAGHLGRVAKNPDRILIVISDGTSDVSNVSSGELTAELRHSAARVYCIGIGVQNQNGRSRLGYLASLTGGGTTFIDSPSEFRRAIHGIANQIGVDFQE